MKIEQLYTNCLAEAAYYIESNGEAAIIDPLREPTPYLEMAQKAQAKIKYVFETHFHADFVSGHVDLAEKTGATIVFGPTAQTNFSAHIAKDNEEFNVGKLTIRVLHTPGHTFESVCYLLLDENKKPTAVFTGDTLFIGDVGRPDLAVKSNYTKEDLAGMLYDSLRNKIMPLPDDVIVYPAHGAGSSCGKNLSSEKTSTIGEQKKSNYALQNISKHAFIKELTADIMPAPQYFSKNALLNKNGYSSLDSVFKKGNHPLTVDEVKHYNNNGVLILDVRTPEEFTQAHIPGSLFIGLDGTFAMWVGALIEDLNQPIILVAPKGRERETITRLSRVGYDNAIGYLDGGIEAWIKAGLLVDTIENVEAEKLKGLNPTQIVDVRKPNEFAKAHLADVINYPLDFIHTASQQLSTEKKQYVHCAGGYRSVIAISILKRKGYKNLVNVLGGWGAISKLDFPIVAETLV